MGVVTAGLGITHNIGGPDPRKACQGLYIYTYRSGWQNYGWSTTIAQKRGNQPGTKS